MKILFLLISSFSWVNLTWSQGNYWVEFTDKGMNASSSFAKEQFLSPNALNRRLFFNLPITNSDLPIDTNYIAAIYSLEAQLKYQSKWLNGIVVETSNSNFKNLTLNLPFVKRVVFLPSGKSQSLNKFSLMESSVEDLPDPGYGFARSNIQMLNGEFLHSNGFKGQTIDIGVMDNGFQLVNTNRFFDTLNLLNRIHGVYNFVENTTNVFSNGDHGAYVMSTLAANIKDTLVGTAPMGNYYLFSTEDNNAEGLAEEINWALAAEWADSALGTWVVLTTSLGYSQGFNDASTNHTYSDMDGNTTLITKAADLAAQKGLLVVNSAGNEGSSSWKYITAPADGDSVLAVGAVDMAIEAAEFTSFGPSADGRVKPNVSALGLRVVAAKYDGTLQSINGTSFSCPIAAGLVACLWQAFPDRTNMEIIQAVEQSAHLYFAPDEQLGFGVPNFKVAYDILELRAFNQENGLILYPNPTYNYLYLTFIEETEGTYDLLIADKSGKVWKSQRDIAATTIVKLNLLDLPVGAYHVFVKQGKNKFSQQFVKR